MKPKFKKFYSLLKGIYQYNILSYFKTLSPTALQINITYQCNSHCQMCQIWKMRPKNELSFSEWERAMQDPIFKNTERLIIAGGEPILHPQLIKLIKLYLKSMPRLQFLTLVTNGFLPQKTVAIIKSLAVLSQKQQLNFSVAVSLDGIGKIHDKIRGVPGVFAKTSTTILALKKLVPQYNFYLEIACLVCRKNLYQVKKVKEWCQANNLFLSFQLIGFHQTYVNNLEKEKALEFKNKDKKYLFSFIKELISSRNSPRFWINSYYWSDMLNLYQGKKRQSPCPFLMDAFVLDSLGDVYYCLSENKIGNYRHGKSVSSIYYDPKNLAFRQRLAKTKCLKCNSACFIDSVIIKNFKKLSGYFLKDIFKKNNDY